MNFRTIKYKKISTSVIVLLLSSCSVLKPDPNYEPDFNKDIEKSTNEILKKL